MEIKVNGVWQSGRPYVKVNGVWQEADSTFHKENGIWQEQKYDGVVPPVSDVNLVAEYDFSNKANLFQDVDRTIPVTAPGQLVSGVTDISGRGFHLVRTNDAGRPTYREDTNGKGYLEFPNGDYKGFYADYRSYNDEPNVYQVWDAVGVGSYAINVSRLSDGNTHTSTLKSDNVLIRTSRIAIYKPETQLSSVAAKVQEFHTETLKYSKVITSLFDYLALREVVVMSPWDTTGITNMRGVFYNAEVCDFDINLWDTSSVTNMMYMFSYTRGFNRSITGWDTSKVEKYYRMFAWNSVFNSDLVLDFTKADTGSDAMEEMFIGAAMQGDLSKCTFGPMTRQYKWLSGSSYNNPTLNDLDISKITKMSGFFYGSQYNRPLDKWDVSHVTAMNVMFYNSSYNQPLPWDTSKVTTFSSMFQLSKFNQDLAFDLSSANGYKALEKMFDSVNYTADLSGCTLGPKTRVYLMFGGMRSNNASIVNLDVSRLTDMSGMFHSSQFNHPLDWDTPNVTRMYRMFYYAKFNSPLSLDMTNVSDSKEMFALSDFNNDFTGCTFGPNTSLQDMFKSNRMYNHPSLIDLDISQLTSLKGMFYKATMDVPLGTWDVSHITDFSHVFQDSTYNYPLDWDVSNGTTFYRMFRSNTVFNQDISDWNVSKATNMSYMFQYATAFNQDLSTWKVPLISSEPPYFDSSSGISGNADFQPQWGVSPDGSGSNPNEPISGG